MNEDHFYIGKPVESCEIVFNSLKGKLYHQEFLDDAKYTLRLFGLSSNWPFWDEYITNVLLLKPDINPRTSPPRLINRIF